MKVKPKKMKTSPTERMSRRYILLETNDIRSIDKSILSLVGALGMSQISPMFVDDANDNLGEDEHILAVETSKLDLVRSAFELSNSKISIKKVSGTIKGLFS